MNSFDDSLSQQQINTQGDGDSIIFTFQINSCLVFNKTLKEVEKFCRDMAQEGGSPIVVGIGELFNFREGMTSNNNEQSSPTN